MSNVVIDLPVPAGNGVGAGPVTSSMGPKKTILVSGAFTGTISIEASDGAGVNYAPLVSFTGPTQVTINVACPQMRVRRSGVGLVPGTPVVQVASDNLQTTNLMPAVPVANGTGTSEVLFLDGQFTSVIVAGVFTGVVIIQASEDGTAWGDFFVFTAPGVQSLKLTKLFMRVVRRGAAAVAPGVPTVAISIALEPVADRYSYPPVFVGPGSVTASPNQVVRVDPTGGAVTVNLPGAGAPVDVAQGQTVIVKNVSASVNAITIDASGLNLIDGATTLVLTAAFASRVLAAQDSVGNWNVVNRFA